MEVNDTFIENAFHDTSMNISLTFCCIIIMLDALIASLYFKNYAGIMDSRLHAFQSNLDFLLSSTQIKASHLLTQAAAKHFLVLDCHKGHIEADPKCMLEAPKRLCP